MLRTARGSPARHATAAAAAAVSACVRAKSRRHRSPGAVTDIFPDRVCSDAFRFSNANATPRPAARDTRVQTPSVRQKWPKFSRTFSRTFGRARARAVCRPSSGESPPVLVSSSGPYAASTRFRFPGRSESHGRLRFFLTPARIAAFACVTAPRYQSTTTKNVGGNRPCPPLRRSRTSRQTTDRPVPSLAIHRVFFFVRRRQPPVTSCLERCVALIIIIIRIGRQERFQT